MSVVLTPIDSHAAESIRAGGRPEGLAFAGDYPTEFTAGIAEAAENGQALGPFFIRRAADGLVVGEIGGDLMEGRTAEIGYAVVRSCEGQGFATAAVRELAARGRETAGIGRLRAHAPLERPGSSRVLEKAGFTRVGERDDEHEGTVLRVVRWELEL